MAVDWYAKAVYGKDFVEFFNGEAWLDADKAFAGVDIEEFVELGGRNNDAFTESSAGGALARATYGYGNGFSLVVFGDGEV